MERMKLQPLNRRIAEALAEDFYVQHGQKFDEFKLADGVLAALAQYVRDEMELHEDLPDSFDMGYTRAVNEILACCATEGGES